MTASQSELQKKLSEDIDICLSSNIQLTDSFETVDSYSGKLDGNGYTIYNLQTQLIRELKDSAIVKDVQFSDVNLCSKGSIFKRNRGLLQSVTVSDLHREIYVDDWEYVGGIVSVNHSSIKDCVVTSSKLNGKHRDFEQSVNSFDITGGICGKSLNDSLIKDCTVSKTEILGELKTGGVVGEPVHCTVEECEVKDSNVVGSKNAGGIGGVSTKTKFTSNSVVNSELESEKEQVSGICGRTKEVESIIDDCTVRDVEFVSPSKISLLGNIHAETNTDAVADSCSVINCTGRCSSNNCEIVFFIKKGTVKNCFTSNVTIHGSSIWSRPDTSVSQSYIEAKIVGDFSDQDLYNEVNTVYADITHSESPEEKTVTVSQVSDLSKVNANDEVMLQDDIDYSKADVDLPVRFSGHLDGNGHTIYNLKSTLFRHLEGAKVEDLTINNPETSIYTRNGVLTSYIEYSEIKNVNIQKTDCDEADFKLCGISSEIKRSEVIECDIELSGHTVSKCYGLFETMHTDSEAVDCTINITLDCEREFAGLGKKLSKNSTISKTRTEGQVRLCKNANYSGLLKENVNDTIVKNCSSTIKVTKKENVSLLKNIGGLIQENHSVIEDCIFAGEIKVGEVESKENIVTIGGIVSGNMGIIRNCENKADIYSKTDGQVGGICGIFYTEEIIDCKNNGNITGGFLTGGIVGYVFRSGTLTRIFNNGNVSGVETVGGLIGKVEKNITVDITNSYSAAVLTSETNQPDPLIGLVEGDTTLKLDEVYWKEGLNPKFSSEYGKPFSSDPEILKTVLQL